VQYCRRQASRQRATRPKACHHCRKTKTKCDFQRPCSRCAARKAPCSYAGDSRVSSVTVTSGGGGADVADLPVVSHHRDTQNPAHGSIAVPEPSDRDHFHLDAGFDGSDLTEDAFLSIFPSLSQMTEAGEGDQALAVDAVCTAPARPSPSFSMLAFPTQCGLDSGFAVYRGSSVADLEVWSRQYIPYASRQLIISIIRSFPRMMTEPNGLPPIVHHLGCGLIYSRSEDRLMPTLHIKGNSLPMKPLAACMSIAQVFVSRVPGSRDFLWTMVDFEVRRIQDEVCAQRPIQFTRWRS